MSNIERIGEQLEALKGKAATLSPEVQEQVADALGALNAMLDGANAMTAGEARISFGPLSFAFDPKKALAHLGKLAPPLKVKKR